MTSKGEMVNTSELEALLHQRVSVECCRRCRAPLYCCIAVRSAVLLYEPWAQGESDVLPNTAVFPTYLSYRSWGRRCPDVFLRYGWCHRVHPGRCRCDDIILV